MIRHLTGKVPARAAFTRLFALSLVCALGCSAPQGPPPPTAGTVEGNLEAICNAYNKACRDLRRPPKNLDEFKPFLKAYGDPDRLLVSPNDGQPFVIVYGASPVTEPTPNNPQIIAYEKTGKDGKRYAVDPRGTTTPFTDAELSRLTFGGGHKLQPGGSN